MTKRSKMKQVFAIALLVLVGYGAVQAWKRGRSRAESDDRGPIAPSPRRIRERSELTVTELAVGSADPVAQATAILTESDERARIPRTADGIEHRRSEDTVEP